MPQTTRKFYKTKVIVEVLSEEPITEEMSLASLEHQFIEGDLSGEVSFGMSKEIGGRAAAMALLKQGSSPEFFRLTPSGCDIDAW